MSYAKWPALAAALALAAGPTWYSSTYAQTQQQSPQQRQQQPPQQPGGQAQNFSDQELKTYAGARLEVRRINQAYQPKAQQAQTEEQQQKLQQQALENIKSAIREEGISVEKYNRITMAVRNDPELASQVQNYMARMQ